MGRHGGTVQRGRSASVLGVLGLAAVLGVGGWQAWERLGPGTTTTALTCTSPTAVRVTTTPAMRDAVESVVRTVTSACATFTVTAEPATATARRFEAGGTGAPAAWLPDSRLLAEQVASGTQGLTVSAPVAVTPVVLAVPKGTRAPNPVRWGQTIVTEACRLPDPNTSTVGSVALMVGLAEIDAMPAAQRSAALSGVGGMLSRVVPEDTLLSVHAGQSDASLFPTTEQQVKAAAVADLTVRVPASATPPLEFPLVTSASSPKEPVAALARALTSTAGRKLLREAGFRTPDDLSPVVDGGPPAEALTATPSPEQVEAAQQMWAAIDRPTRLLTVIDTSGSMSNPSAVGGGSRIAVASRAASGAVQLLADHNAVGLWTFSTAQKGTRDWTELEPVARLGANDQRSKLSFALGSLGSRLGGDTGLYDTLDAAYASVLAGYDPQAVNLVAIFTDGVNDDTTGGLSLAALRADLAKRADADKPVTVLLIGMGGVDAKALAPVAAAVPRGGGGGGAVFVISTPQDIANVYVTMLLRRLPKG